jgi:hypothetical protein
MLESRPERRRPKKLLEPNDWPFPGFPDFSEFQNRFARVILPPIRLAVVYELALAAHRLHIGQTCKRAHNLILQSERVLGAPQGRDITKS